MNARIRKEIRNHLPALLCGAALYGLPFLWIGEVLLVWLVLVHIVACSLLATSSIGGDLSHAAVEAEMALPIGRDRRWHERLAVMTAGLFVLILIYSGILILAPHGFPPNHELFAPMVAAGFLLPLLAGALGPAVTLAIGETRAGLIVTVLSVSAIATIVWLWSGPATSMREALPMIQVCAAVSVVALAHGQRRYLRWQSYNPLTNPFTGLRLPTECATSGSTRRDTGRAALFLLFQEFRLQQINLIAFAAILVFAVLVRSGGDWHNLASVAWTIIWPFPVFLGLASVSEERRLGIHNQRLAQPVSPLRQWTLKFLANFAIAAAVGLGTLLTLDLLEFTVAQTHPFNAIPWFLGAACAGVIFGMAASGIATNYLTSLGALMALATVWGIGAYPLARALPDFNYVSSDKIFQVVWTSVFILSLVLTGYRAFRADEPFGRRLRGIAAGIAISLPASLAIAAALYFRMWEPFLFTMPPAGPAVFTTNSPPLLSQRYGGFYVSENGELLSSGLRRFFSENFNPLKQPVRIAPGNDWKQVAGDTVTETFIALRSDGTLWYQGLEAWQEIHRLNADKESWRGRFEFPTNLTQFGTNSDWITISGQHSCFAGIRKDGSLWQWGTTGGGRFGFLAPRTQSSTNRPAPLETIHTPRRIGTNNHWKALQIGPLHSAALSKDGRIWAWGNTSRFAYAKAANNGETNLDRYIVSKPILIPRFTSLRADDFQGDLFVRFTDGTVAETSLGLWEIESDLVPIIYALHPDHPDVLIFKNRLRPSPWQNPSYPTIDKDFQLLDPQTSTAIDPTPTWIDQIGSGGMYYLRTDASIWRYTSFHFTPHELLNRHLHRAGKVPWEDRPAILPPFRLHRIGWLPMEIVPPLETTNELP